MSPRQRVASGGSGIGCWLFWGAHVLWLPALMVGYVLWVGKLVLYSRRAPGTTTMLASVYPRWMMHRVRQRRDDACVRLVRVLPNVSQPGLWLLAAPTLLAVDREGRVVKRSGPEVAATRPGSTVKPFTLAALLDAPGFDPVRRLGCSGRLRLGGRSFDCSHAPVPGGLDAEEALAFSCNSYFASMAGRFLDPAGFQRFLAGWGLRASLASGPDGLRRQALGEDFVAVTPLELAQAYRRLASRESDPKLLFAFRGLRLAVTAGTAHEAGAVFVGGKTGTAATEGRRSLQGWFAGFTREHVVVVFVPTGRGAVDAAPLARRALP